jgi:hypothetical protein
LGEPPVRWNSYFFAWGASRLSLAISRLFLTLCFAVALVPFAPRHVVLAASKRDRIKGVAAGREPLWVNPG